MAKTKKRFVVKKRLSLDFFGPDWAECYIDYTPITYTEANSLKALRDVDPATLDETKREELAQQTIDMLKSHFVSGKGYTEAGVVDLEPDDLTELPVEIITKSIVILRGNIDPNLAAASVS